MQNYRNIVAVLVIAIFLCSMVGESQNYDSYYAISRDQVLAHLGNFEKMLNSSQKPTFQDYSAFFSEGSELELKFVVMNCIQKGLTPCSTNEACQKLYSDEKTSYFIEFLKSKDGPIFSYAPPNSKTFKLYVYPEFSTYNSNPKLIHVEALLYFAKNAVVPMDFYFTSSFNNVSLDGAISALHINGKAIDSIVNDYFESKGINIDKQCADK